MMYPLYKASSSLLKSFVQSHIEKRVSEGKEDPTRISERYGLSQVKRPKGPLIWFHAASIGESMSIQSLIKQLLKLHDSFHILVTTGTTSSARVMEEKLPERCVHQYVPMDVIDWVKAFLNHWQPDLAIWVESEFWPNLLYQARRRGTPIILLNGSISDKSYRRWKNFGFLTPDFLENFNLCIAQSKQDESRLKDLGAKHICCYGNLKYASSPLRCDELELKRLRDICGNRPLWLAASTHKGEENLVTEAHQILKKKYPDILTIIAPRHVERGLGIRTYIEGQGIKVHQRSRGDRIKEDTEIYLADTLGELGLFYHLTNIALVAGSFGDVGGHNLIEPAQLDCAILHGPHMFKQKEMAELFQSQDAALEVLDAGDLAQKIHNLLSDTTHLGTYQRNSKQLAESQVKVIEAVLHELLPYLRNLVENDHQRTSILV